jgi:hypothetical protein
MEPIDRLNAFVGEWAVEADLPGEPLRGHTTFEWALGGQFLVQKTTVPDPVPDSLSVYSADPYRQHYYDSRGVVRLYDMTLEGDRWTLERRKPDFSPLPFHQRWIAGIGEDVIRGRWEKSEDGEQWELDFRLVYTKVG